MTELRTCAHCGTAEGELTEFNDRLYCPDCLDDLTLVCTDCGRRGKLPVRADGGACHRC